MIGVPTGSKRNGSGKGTGGMYHGQGRGAGGVARRFSPASPLRFFPSSALALATPTSNLTTLFSFCLRLAGRRQGNSHYACLLEEEVAQMQAARERQSA